MDRYRKEVLQVSTRKHVINVQYLYDTYCRLELLTKINASTLSDSNPSFCEMVSRRHLTTSKTRSAKEMLCMIPTACKWYDSEFKSEAGRNKASETSMGCNAWTKEGNDVMSLDKPTGSKLLKLYLENHVMLTQL